MRCMRLARNLGEAESQSPVRKNALFGFRMQIELSIQDTQASTGGYNSRFTGDYKNAAQRDGARDENSFSL